jgi:hypothetical protein
MLRFLLLTLILLPTALSAQERNVAGDDGTNLGREIVESLVLPEHDPEGGVGGQGRVRFGELEMDVGSLVPGADRSQVSEIGNDRSSMSSLESRGIERFNQGAAEEGTAGEVTRALLNQARMSTSELLAGDASLLETAQTALTTGQISILGEFYADCSTTSELVPGDTIWTVHTQTYTCAAGVGAGGGGACTRSRELRILYDEEFPERECPPLETFCDVVIPEPGEPEFVITGVEDLVTRDSWCDEDLDGSGCEVQWECLDSEPRQWLDVALDEAFFQEWNIAPLAPGISGVCWEARAVPTCPVCMEYDDGTVGDCTYVELDFGSDATCASLEARTDCQQAGQTCLVSDPDVPGACLSMGVTYACSEQVQVPTSTLVSNDSCAGTIQCIDGSCDGGLDLTEEQAVPMHIAMAQMAVASTLMSDVDYTEGQGSGPGRDGNGPPPPQRDPNNLALNWGYDLSDTGGPDQEAPPPGGGVGEQYMIDVQLFKGEAFNCQKGYAGLVDCCRATNSNADELFWQIYAEVNRTKQAQTALAAGEGGQSGYEVMAQGGAGMATLSNPFTSLRANVLGGGGGGFEETAMTVHQMFMQRAREEIKPSLSPSWICKDHEFDLAVQREIGSCSYAGLYCSQRVLGVCLKRRESYCCYRSPMSKMLRESADGGTLDHGNARNPDCRGIPIDRLDDIDWSVLNFEHLAGHMAKGGAFDKASDTTNAPDRFTGSGMVAGGEGRQDVTTRTTQRLQAIDADVVYANIEADARSHGLPGGQQLTPGPASVGFSTAYRAGAAGVPLSIGLRRQGSQGAVTAAVRVVEGQPALVGLGSAVVSWPPGDTSERSLRLDPPAGASGRVVLEVVPEGAGQGANPIMTVEIFAE